MTETKTKTKTPKAKAAHPSYSTMVTEAIVALKERGGSSRPAILKYIKSTYKVGDNLTIINNSIKRALKSGVTGKILTQAKGVGANGSFKIAKDEAKKKKVVAKKPAKVVKPKAAVKKPAKKIVKPKAAAKKPKKGSKSPKKVARPKKVVTPKTAKPKKPAAKKVVKPKKAAVKKPAKK